MELPQVSTRIAMTPTANRCGTSPIRPIAVKLEELGKILNLIGDNLDDLRQIIDPILHPQNMPASPPACNEKGPVPVQPPLAELLSELVAQANVINDNIIRLKDRVAL